MTKALDRILDPSLLVNSRLATSVQIVFCRQYAVYQDDSKVIEASLVNISTAYTTYPLTLGADTRTWFIENVCWTISEALKSVYGGFGHRYPIPRHINWDVPNGKQLVLGASAYLHLLWRYKTRKRIGSHVVPVRLDSTDESKQPGGLQRRPPDSHPGLQGLQNRRAGAGSVDLPGRYRANAKHHRRAKQQSQHRV